jgi:hypothetical protein
VICDNLQVRSYSHPLHTRREGREGRGSISIKERIVGSFRLLRPVLTERAKMSSESVPYLAAEVEGRDGVRER